MSSLKIMEGNLVISTALESGEFHTALPLLENMTSNQLSELICTLPDMCTPLHYACQYGRVDVAQQIITHCKYSIESNDGKGCTPLHTAAQYGQVSTFKYLLHNLFVTKELSDSLKLRYGNMLAHTLKSLFQKKLSYSHRDENGNTPLHTACVYGQLDIVQLLTLEIGCDPNDTNSEVRSCLHLAVWHGHLALVRYLIEEVGSDVTLEDGHGKSSIYLAAGGGHLDILKYLLGEKGADPHYTTNREWKFAKVIVASSRSLVHTASYNGHLHVVRYLVEEHGCDSSHKDDKGITLLYLACQQGHMEIIAYLITERNCDPNCTSNDGSTCLHAASRGSGDLSEVIKYLVINHNCSLLVKNKFGNLPLHFAARNGNLDAVKFILDMDCDPNCKGELERIPLHYASKGGHIEVVKFLVDKHHSDPLCLDEHKNTPLHLAVKNNNLSVVKLFIEEKGCNPNIQGHLKWRPLHISLKHRHFGMSMYLIGLPHCDVLATVSDGSTDKITPLSLAVESQNLDIITYLCSTRRLDPYLQPNKEKLLQSTSNAEILEYLEQFPDPLHTAAVYGDTETVRHYVEREKWCPKKFDRYGNNTLHNAAQHGQLEVVKYLTGLSKDPINEEVEILCDPLLKNKYGVTALEIASQNRHHHVESYLLRTTIKSVLHQDIISPSLNIFIVGNSGSGKSTLVKALSSESSLLGQFTKVKGVLPLTAGVVPTTLDSQVFGKVKIYDFAGHEEYYASHEMILGQTTQPLVLLTVDISKQDSEILKQLSYWLSILSSSVTADAQFRMIHVVIIGSHADQVKLFQSRKQIHQDVTSLVSSEYSLKYHGFIQCDCRSSTSDNMKYLRQKLNTICKSVRLFLAHESDLSNKCCASLMYHIEHSMSKEITMTVNKLHKLITSSLTPGSSLVQFEDSDLLLETCKSLSSNGHLLLLPHDDDDAKESLLILDNEFILSKVHACLALIKKRLTNEIGILEESQLRQILSELFVESMKSELAIKYLVFAQFCTKVSSDQLISVPANMSGTSHYFFPNLAQASRPADLFPKESSLYTWCLKCSDSHHFFTPRYLHTLFIQLVKCQSDTDNIKFSIWKNGILLVHCGTRSIIEVTDQSTQFYLVTQCMKGCESHLVKQRSCLIALIKTLLVKGCPNLNLDEFLLAPHQVYPPSNTALIRIADVAHSIVTGHPTVPFELSRGSSPQQVLLDKLLSFDSFHVIEKSLLQSIFAYSHSSNIVPLATMERVHCAVNLCRDLAENLEDAAGQCRRDMTYSQLYRELIKYSIFTDGNLYVSHIFYRMCVYELVTLLLF